MKMLALILSFGFLYAQTPATWWASADSNQKAFAAQCYEFGKQYGRGHTLIALAWAESSLGRDIEHDEESFGPFGISNRTRRCYLGKEQTLQRKWVDERRLDKHIALDEGTFGNECFLALQIFEDNIGYFRRLGFSPAEAYFWAYPRYNAGNKWRRFRRRGEVFRMRVRFLQTQFK